MKVISLKLRNHLTPNGSSGTGYSEPDLFDIRLENGSMTDLMVDIWYCPSFAIKNVFEEAVNEEFADNPIDNLDEMWDMYLNEIAEYTCP